MDKKQNQARLRRARRPARKIAELKRRCGWPCIARTATSMRRSSLPTGAKVLASASTLEADVRKDRQERRQREAAAAVGKRIAEKAKALGIEAVAFDRAG